MLRKTVKNLILVQLVSVVGLIGCVVIKPHGLTANAGLSYFGNYRVTILPYGLVVLGSSYFYYKSRKSLPAQGYKLTKISFGLFSLLLIGIFMTPYSVSNLLSWIHSILGIILFTTQLLVTAWELVKSDFNRLLGFSWLIMLVSGIACAIYTPIPTGYLLESQVIFEIAFCLFYVKYLSMDKSVHKAAERSFYPLLSHK